MYEYQYALKNGQIAKLKCNTVLSMKTIIKNWQSINIINKNRRTATLLSTMKLEISLHASKLKNVAGAFKGTSDPYAVVTHIATTPGSKPEVLGKTEM